MINYRKLKSASKTSVAKVKVVTKEAVKAADAVWYKEGDDIPENKSVGDIKTYPVSASDEQSHEILQLSIESYDSNTGEKLDNVVKTYDLGVIGREIVRCKEQVKEIEETQSNWEELEKDLKAL